MPYKKESYLKEPFFTDKKIIVTGGCGFIGSNLIRRLIRNSNSKIFNIDKLSYASDSSGIEEELTSNNITDSSRYELLKIDLADFENLNNTIHQIKPDLIFHLAAESHVDRSIENPEKFLSSNVVGTFNLLESVRNYYSKLDISKKDNFRFHHISTDEVFGSLGEKGYFSEKTSYSPRSPYSATKAASDHFVEAWFHTFGIPTLITNCSNNYGPWQFIEKFIPVVIFKALAGKPIPIYGQGTNIRDWLFVEDHVEALLLVASNGKIGKKYCIGGSNEKTNLEVSKTICKLLDELAPSNNPHEELIDFVSDRPGHDHRYAIDFSLINKELGWSPRHTFEEGLKITVDWYLKNVKWCKYMQEKSGYKGQRIGLK